MITWNKSIITSIKMQLLQFEASPYWWGFVFAEHVHTHTHACMYARTHTHTKYAHMESCIIIRAAEIHLPGRPRLLEKLWASQDQKPLAHQASHSLPSVMMIRIFF